MTGRKELKGNTTTYLYVAILYMCGPVCESSDANCNGASRGNFSQR